LPVLQEAVVVPQAGNWSAAIPHSAAEVSAADIQAGYWFAEALQSVFAEEFAALQHPVGLFQLACFPARLLFCSLCNFQEVYNPVILYGGI